MLKIYKFYITLFLPYWFIFYIACVYSMARIYSKFPFLFWLPYIITYHNNTYLLNLWGKNDKKQKDYINSNMNREINHSNRDKLMILRLRVRHLTRNMYLFRVFFLQRCGELYFWITMNFIPFPAREVSV